MEHHDQVNFPMDGYDIVIDTYGDDFCTRYDAKKLLFPYNARFEMLLLPHKPPQPVERTDVGLNLHLAIERIQIHPLTRWFMHPPAAGTLVSGEPLSLCIVAALDAQDGRTAQLVVAEGVSSKLNAHSSTTTAASDVHSADIAAVPAQLPLEVA